MECVKNLVEIKENMKTLDGYLNKKIEPEYSFALNLIKKGTCFIAVKQGNEYRFYPSRFMGYAKNTMNNHLNNDTKDGKKTNPAISNIFKPVPLSYDVDLERAYVEYCYKLGFIANVKGTFGVQRKYWKMF